MRLESIELTGFKSFADKTKLEFTELVSGIVGPNGSGKSNISDGIRWVLGEQSAKSLRGAKMEDVIFSGTEKRSPLNYAKVSINFNNEDGQIPIPYSTVNVTRKVYRSGESEYRINNSTARLKDVREMFLDTGIGKEGYSIIGQGRIEEILNSRSEDRRELFEEASGISKFKYKKLESERKLAKVNENLGEIHIQLREQKSGVDFLFQQAERAKKGMELSKELEKSEFSLLKKELGALDKELSDLEMKIRERNEEISEESQRREGLEEALLPLKREYEALEKEVVHLNQQREDTDKKILKLESEASLHREKEKYLRRDVERMEEEIYGKEEMVRSGSKELSSLGKNLDGRRQGRLRIREILNSNKEELKKSQQQLLELKEETDQLIKEKNETQRAYQKLNLQKQTSLGILESQRTQIQEKEEKIAQEKKKLEELELSFAESERRLEEFKKNLEGLKDEKTGQESQIKELAHGLQSEQTTLMEFKSKLRQLESNQTLLKNLYDSFEGYYKPVQQLLSASKKDEQLRALTRGTLADLIEVQPEYQTAIDIALGSSLQNIVTTDEKDAKRLIEYLNKNNIGRITFLPVNKIQGKAPVNVKEPEVLILASKAVKCDPDYRNILDYFLNRTLIVENLDAAIRLSRKTRSAARIITLKGEVINTWGSMVGGATNKKASSSLINRKSSMEELSKDIRSLQEKISKSESTVDLRSQAMKELEEELEKRKEQIQAGEEELRRLESGQSTLVFKKTIASSNVERLFQEIQQMTTAEGFNEDSSLDEFQKKEEEINALLLQKNSDLDHLTRSVQGLDKEVALNENKLEVEERDIAVLENDLIDLENKISDAKNGIELNHRLLKNVLSETEGIQKSLVENEVARDKAKKNLENILTKIREKKEDKHRIKEETETEDEKLKVCVASLAELEKKFFALQYRLEAVGEKKNSAIAMIMEDYDLTELQLKEKLSSMDAISTTPSKVKQLKEQLREIGYYKYESIEEYRIAKKSYDELMEQALDLENSQKDIRGVIGSLEKQMNEMFSASFKAINLKFDEIFKILFNGGKAELLLDSSDVLNAGIEIIASPPGKKLQNLGLLSGGERALTAVALLFAIFETRPAPFCILDEIDASLDEVNIGRYINYLKSFGNQVQFIIITHRKTTMEMADMLYGVTMQEEGVSTVLQLNLTKTQ